MSYKFACFPGRLPDLLQIQWPGDSLRKVTKLVLEVEGCVWEGVVPVVTLYLPCLTAYQESAVCLKPGVQEPDLGLTRQIEFLSLDCCSVKGGSLLSLFVPQDEISKSISLILHFCPIVPSSKNCWLVNFIS